MINTMHKISPDSNGFAYAVDGVCVGVIGVPAGVGVVVLPRRMGEGVIAVDSIFVGVRG